MISRCQENDNARYGHNKCFILRLPIELQTQIFTECASRPYGQLMDARAAPQVFLLVCKYWRDLAYATSSLWSSFELHFGTWPLNFEDPEGDAPILLRMKLWLRRSGNYPLTVKLQYKPSMSTSRDETSRFPTEALTLLMQHCKRWREIELSMPNPCLTPLIRAAHELDFPLLSSLILNPLPSTHSESLDFRDFSSNCGRLTHLHTNLEAGRMLTLDECGIILAQHPNLISCTLYAQCIFDGSSQAAGSADKFNLPALTEFHLMVHNNSGYTPDTSLSPEAALTTFLGRLELCVLNVLHIEWLLDGNRALWTTSHPSFVSFLETIEPTLEILSLGYLPLSDEQLIDCLRAVPYLTSLELLFSLGEEPEGPAITDKLFRALTLNTKSVKSDNLLPMLQSLTLQCQGDSCSEEETIRFLASRAEEELHALQVLKFHTQVPILRNDTLQSRWSESSIKLIEVCGND
ncbi:hypothetical protein DFJ43DRAFT_1152170 [Lentinula guzmanii]|uniref:F-box domain-containing protein n=1 Tax=Lentinula guzmanii TaxID=2804957 RepID=A0AA38N330_9AGAR|nr:hypothetical protein DFJ43DRAFT_1152170 [Lentinula guzmanii]